ncbi:MAG: methyltransferase domain-containing protein [Bacteroidetes bacterium]|nr:methyltransferase domain-containing protein [Bacteroidota bacterium]MCL6100370.1 methyltransferase domain-containing protein [Bacteroidota bacterium]
MAITGKFNTDSKALVNRINAHDKFGSKDINEWIFQKLELKKGLQIVDLGCGTGKQTIPMAEIVGPSGSVTAVDVSSESINILSREAIRKSIDKNITVMNCDLDDWNKHLGKTKFDRALASFSIYYSKNPEALFETVCSVLKPNGLFFFCGPSLKNNSEIKEFIAAIKNSSDESVTGGADFMEKTGQLLAHKLFKAVEVSIFENPLKFDSPDSLYQYWSSCNMYDEKIDAAFQKAAQEHFKTNKYFAAYKRVIGVKAKKL